MPTGVSIVPRHSDPRSDRKKERECSGRVGPTPRPIDRGRCVPDATLRGQRRDNLPLPLGIDPANYGPVVSASRMGPALVRDVPTATVAQIGPVRVNPVHRCQSSSDRRPHAELNSLPARGPRGLCPLAPPRWQDHSRSPNQDHRRLSRRESGPIGRLRDDSGAKVFPRADRPLRFRSHPRHARKPPRDKIGREPENSGPGAPGGP